MTVLLIILIIIGVATLLFLNTERFGKHPSGERLLKIEQSPNYKNGRFQNLNHTPMLTEGVGYSKVLYQFLFSSKPKEPSIKIPSIKTDLKNLKPDENVLIWMGHSSYFIQLDGKTILVDPVLSGNASPLSFTTKAYNGTNIYTTDDIPKIDYLFLSHDHWDHMDYKTLKKLKPKIKTVITGLGNGAHLEHWGFNQNIILEGDWYDNFSFDDEFEVHITPARHFSGRGFTSAKTLWASFVLKTPTKTIFIGGDSGYDSHFKEIGNKFGPFDLVILENGQYDNNWKHIHMLPGEQLKAANDLNTTTILPVHAGKFTLANHNWDEPFINISNKKTETDIKIITPMIGVSVNLKDSLQQFKNWWN
ncbi:L-ascorbate metabolism protein UlaG, beta-lactamase superfamily [Mesonia phycicola]|uniref:L-ascorbate metabolism protein UlaG, beta-lactamase superfamily n=1 Tax=Mesonia phycicola TaxID=579105 RepID=A0A1M6CJM2_9FLAO|nr:MBL fold metallo-hydrolase [Mesonia phycicola]SHI61196.1 L-ascorbate metabolism protein UlaG, beta-lactamase superfamily [Mesonia phycicola]